MEEKKIQAINLSVKILNIKLDDYKIVDVVPAIIVNKLNKEKIQFEFNIEMNTNLIKKNIHIVLTTQLFADEEKKINLGYIKSSGDFEVLNIEDITKGFDGKVPNVIFANFIGVLLSTTRGFLILKSEGTIIEGVYMPMMNPMNFFPQTTVEAKK